MNRLKVFFILMMVGLSLEANAASFVKYSYKIKKGDSFVKILQKFVKPNSVINADTPMIKQIRAQNPNIKNWKKLKAGQEITVFVNPTFLDTKKVEKLLAKGEYITFEEKQKRIAAKKAKKAKALAAKKAKEEKKKEEAKKKALAAKKKKEAVKKKKSRKQRLAELRKRRRERVRQWYKARPVGFHSSAFYMASLGTFDQASNDGNVDISINQNSFWTLGLAGLYYIKNKKHSYSSSIYLSSLEAPKSSLNDSEIDIPFEIGVNAYYQYDFYRKKYSVYGGIDYESFTSYDLGVLQSNKKIVLKNNSVFYATVGATYLFKIKKQTILSKFSISKSLVSSSSSDSSLVGTLEGYDGIKLMGYLNYKFAKRWFAHTLYKMHIFSGDDETNISRIGLGFGFIIN